MLHGTDSFTAARLIWHDVRERGGVFPWLRHRPVYTLGAALRILHVKNLGMDFAPEELRICPYLSHGPWGPEKFSAFRCNNVQYP